MLKHPERYQSVVIIGVFTLFLLFIFRPFFLNGKILFPSNLLLSAYAPWKYEPLPEYPNGPPNKPIGFDDIREFLPNRKLLAESLVKGILPLWNPYIYSGTPFMASFDTAVWYPLSWIAALLPLVDGWNFLVVVQPVLSLLFMYLLLRSMKFEPRVAAFGSFAYAFSGWMIVYWQEILVLEHSFLWLPLALYGSNRLWDYEDDRLGIFLLTAALAFSVFGGFLQMSIYVYAVVFTWNVYRYITSVRDHAAGITGRNILFSMAISLGLAAVQLVPSIEAFFLSPRGTENGLTTFSNFLLPFQHLVTLIAPDFWGNPGVYNYFGGMGFYFEKMIYIGIIPLAFALLAFITKSGKSSVFWKVTAVIALSLGFALPTSWMPYVLRIPVLSNSYPTRIFGVFTLSAVIVACFGLQSYLKVPDRKHFAWIAIFCTAILGGLWLWAGFFWLLLHQFVGVVDICGKLAGLCHIYELSPLRELAPQYVNVSLHNLFVPSLFVAVLWILVMIAKRRNVIYAVVCISTLMSSLYFAQKYVQFSDRRFVYPELPVISELSTISVYDRVWGYGDAFIETNLPQYFHWYSTDGYGNLSSRRYAELLSTIVTNGRLGGPIRRSDTDIYGTGERDSISSNPNRLRIMSLLGVSYILELKQSDTLSVLSTELRFPHTLFQLVWQNNTWRVWKYTGALPRALFTTSYIVANTPQQEIDDLYDPKTNLTSTVLFETNPKYPLQPVTKVHTNVNITSYQLNSVTLDTDSDADGYVVLTDNYYPGWTATVDGRNTAVLRADYTLRAVYVPKGRHSVIFQYAPKSVIIGAVISVFAVVILALLLIVRRR